MIRCLAGKAQGKFLIFWSVLPSGKSPAIGQQVRADYNRFGVHSETKYQNPEEFYPR